MRKHILIFLLLAAVVCALPASCARKDAAKPVAKAVTSAPRTPGARGLVGAAAPEFSLKDLSGLQVRLADLRGKTVLLDFWATWCPPCRRALPHIQKVHDDYGPLGLEVLGINSEPPDKPRSYLARHGYTFTTLSDPGGRVTGSYGVTGIPTTVIIDESGTVSSYSVGYKTESELRGLLARAGLTK